MKFSSRGFTLVELMIVIAIIGILAAALFPSYVNYVQRGRDTARVASIDDLSKQINLYFSENDKFPTDDGNGCVDNAKLSNYNAGKAVRDPVSTKSNGCNTLGLYAYAMSTGILSNPNVFSLIAIMEQQKGGNYSGSMVGFTGILSSAAYNTGLLYTVKGAGPIYVRVP